jgi:uncharacterized membrane protein
MIPIHPIVDHFTIALFTIAVLFEIFGWLIKNDTLKAVAWWNLFFATLAAIGSYTTGLLIAGVEPHPETARQAVQTHETLGTITMALIVVVFLWRTVVGENFMDRFKGIYLLVCFIGLAFLFFTGWHGGKLVYDHGVGVKPVIEEMLAPEPVQQAEPTYDQLYQTAPVQEPDTVQVQDYNTP